ncbi:S8 family serine peptidase [Aromatoleum petrolei]|uniref:S8 family serine peptidase n=1 Tax=Aromatoleum petrolei TaxID=76116 RepID=A0ABX1MRE5_9RHOO|nr:S8 family serine peptidase [Aromatoleum petrolei]NMF89188.1 S8 family serine peptidase [Aromatoleum petrolei]QTQ36494.1 Subtilase family protein [Aromatoleum petrolei]
MRKGLLAATMAASLAGLPAVSAAQAQPGNLGVSVEVREEVHNSFIFVLRDDVAANEVARHANALAAGAGGRVTHTYTTALKGFAAKMPDEAAARVLAANPLIASYEPDAIAYAFAKPGTGGGTVACTAPETTPWGVTRVGGAGDGTGRTAWVIDTGIDFEHPDLNVDVARSKSFLLRGKTTADDGNGHGTHVAGTIAAKSNGCDVIGVAAGATVVAVRVLDNSGSGSYSGVIKGIDYVAQVAKAGDVANMSLGGGYSASLNAAVETAAGKGIFFSLAAGNESDDAARYSPASASGANIYTVSAIDSADKFAWFSNYGNPPVDCAAPGVNVVSTKNGGGVTTFSGTSMAAPHVAGILLLGTPTSNGSAGGDPDGKADPICHR